MNSAGGSFGLSFGLAFAGAIMLATLSFTFTTMADDSDVLAAGASKEQVAEALEDDAEVHDATRSSRSCSPSQPAGDPGRDHPDQHRRPTASRSRSRCSSRCSPRSSAWSTRSG